MSGSHKKTLTDTFSCLTVKMSSVRVEHVIHCAKLLAMTVLVLRMKDDMRKAIFNVSVKFQKMY